MEGVRANLQEEDLLLHLGLSQHIIKKQKKIMGRSKWKSFYCKKKSNLFDKKLFFDQDTLWDKSTTISPTLLGKKIRVYTGKDTFLFTIKSFMLGFKIGDFMFTKKESKHLKKVIP